MGRLHRFIAIAVPGCSLVAVAAMSSVHESACAVRGVWELVSTTNNGKEQPLNGARQMKIVTPHHFIWISQDAKRDTLPLKTQADTLLRNSVGGGAGTYTASGNSYVEHIEFFNDPSFIGKPWKATCRVEGDRWYHSWAFPQDSSGIPRDSIAHVVEVWRRVE